MVIWSSGLGAGLQTQLGGFDSYYHLNGFGGNPRIDDESMSTKTPRGQVTGDGSYLFLEWLDTISRYGSTHICTFEGWAELKCTIYLVGVTEAYLFYMQREVVRFHYEVQKESKSRSDTAT